MTLPLLPPPDLEEHETELWGQNVCDDYWRLAKVKEYGAACAAAERERCAKLCDEFAMASSNPMNFAENCAAAIRAQEKT